MATKTRIKIGKTKALQALKRAVDKRGDDYVADKCRYWDAGRRRPGCIVGAALRDLGLSPQALRELDLLAASAIGTTSTLEALRAKGVIVNEDARQILQTAQRCQDSRQTWGEVLDQAKLTARTIETTTPASAEGASA